MNRLVNVVVNVSCQIFSEKGIMMLIAFYHTYYMSLANLIIKCLVKNLQINLKKKIKISIL